MVFHEFTYLLFFLTVMAIYWCLPALWKNVLLIVAGYVFYGWEKPWYTILLGGTTVVDFFCARAIGATEDRLRKRRFLLISVIANFTVLGCFKYLTFVLGNFRPLFPGVSPVISWWVGHIGLPAGVSFITFQNVGYVIDVYRGHTQARRSFIDYACFASFFPQLVAGPIERSANLLKQVERRRFPDLIAWRSGLILILWGLFQKIVIADSAALLANKVFSVGDATFPVLWGGVIAFGVQIYADFSAYTDMARGSARLLGFDLLRNFNHPYLAQSPPEFWRRWHMTLSTWFRDYVYIPLGGSRSGPWKTARNLVITFFLSGLWHGASWNFVLWGLYHGILVAGWPYLASKMPLFGKAGGKAGIALRVLLTFALANLGWLMFREQNLAMLARDLTLNPFAASALQWRLGAGIATEAILYGLPLMLLLPLVQKWSFVSRHAVADDQDPAPSSQWKLTALQTFAAALIVTAIVFLRCDVGSDFIYFQF